MAKEVVIEQPHDATETKSKLRTFLGSTRLNTRVALFVFVSLLSIISMAGLLLSSDRRLSNALNSLKTNYNVTSLISRLETVALAINSTSQDFVRTKDKIYAETYEKKSSTAAQLLILLQKSPATGDVRKILSTLTSSITLHATHFQNLVGMQSVIGTKQDNGLKNKAAVSGKRSLQSITATRNSKLIAELGTIRELETNLTNSPSLDAPKRIMDAIANFRQSLIVSNLSRIAKRSIDKGIKVYAADIERLAQTRLIQMREVMRMEEVNVRLTSNLKTLINFAENMSHKARQISNSTQVEIRRIMGWGTGTIMVVLSFFGAFLMGSIVRPVKMLARSAMELANGNATISIPVLENHDETGDLAVALSCFRDNMNQADKLRQELEAYLRNSKNQNIRSPAELSDENVQTNTLGSEIEKNVDIQTDDQRKIEENKIDSGNTDPSQKGQSQQLPLMSREQISSATTSQKTTTRSATISHVSKLVAQTSLGASNAAKDAERCDLMANELTSSLKKIKDIELLLISMGDHMTLLSVQSSITKEKLPDSSQSMELKVSEFVSDNIQTLQGGTKRAVRAVQQVGISIKSVNKLALQMATESSNEALEAATELLRQSEDLRDLLDNMLDKAKLGEHT